MCALAAATNNSGLVVSVEPDVRAHVNLLKNREQNSCNAHVMLGSVADRPIGINRGRNNGYDLTTSEAIPNGHVLALPNLNYTQVERHIGARFNAIVVDCEGCIEMVLGQAGLLAQLDLIMIEEDLPDKVSYASWHAKLRAAGFEQVWRLRDTMYRFAPVHKLWSIKTFYSVWRRTTSQRPRGPTCEEYARSHPRLLPFHLHGTKFHSKNKSGIDCIPLDAPAATG